MNPISKNGMYAPADMAGRPALTPPTECGERLAALRKAAGLSQAQLADAIGIPQRTLSFYERKADHLPSTLVPKLAEVFGVGVDEILGIHRTGSRRGPKTKLERQLDAVRQLPKSKQKFVSEFLDTVLQSAG